MDSRDEESVGLPRGGLMSSAEGAWGMRVGWEFDVRREGAIRIDVPVATGVTGMVSATFIPNSRGEATVGDRVRRHRHLLRHRSTMRPYDVPVTTALAL